MRKIAFALLSNSRNPIPSTRIACLNLFPYLHQAGYLPDVVFEPVEPHEMPRVDGLVEKVLDGGYETVVFQKIHGDSVLQAIKRLRQAGVRTIYSVCDLVDNDMAGAVDATVAVTHYLRSMYDPRLHPRIHVVHDGIERPDICRKVASDRPQRGARSLIAGLVTSHSPYAVPVLGVLPDPWRAHIIGRFPAVHPWWQRLRRARWGTSGSHSLTSTLRILRAALHPRVRHISWDPVTVYNRLLACDIGIIPIDAAANGGGQASPPGWKLKSENRLTLKMALGLPVIATPIPSYEAVIRHAENGFFARSRADWLSCLKRLQDPQVRMEVGARARQAVLARYSMEAQAQAFIDVLEAVRPAVHC
jgi:glycosyltransferase involved in cell wall biosynthesis